MGHLIEFVSCLERFGTPKHCDSGSANSMIGWRTHLSVLGPRLLRHCENICLYHTATNAVGAFLASPTIRGHNGKPLYVNENFFVEGKIARYSKINCCEVGTWGI